MMIKFVASSYNYFYDVLLLLIRGNSFLLIWLLLIDLLTDLLTDSLSYILTYWLTNHLLPKCICKVILLYAKCPFLTKLHSEND